MIYNRLNMGLNGVFVVNKYYSDKGMEFVFDSLVSELSLLKISLKKDSFNLTYDGISTKINGINNYDFAIFWDKNVYLASQMENCGLKVFNCAHSIALCDDKQLTYNKLKNVRIPKTVCPPKMYDNALTIDNDFLDYVANQLNFPMIIKENTGSQGRQVFLANNAKELKEIYSNLRFTNHHYQQFIGEFGVDLRFYVVGDEVVAHYKRKGTGFKSNLFTDGSVLPFKATQQMKNQAINIINQLGLDFGTADFLICNNDLVFLEANSNAYFNGAHQLGFNVAKAIAIHIKKTMEKNNGRK